MVSLRWIDERTARWIKKKQVAAYACVCVCVCRSPQDEVQPPMEPIAEENIEMPEAHADTESRNMLRYLVLQSTY